MAQWDRIRMKTYEALTLSQFIELLDTLGDAPVKGFDGSIHSYRGHYERNATAPATYTMKAADLADTYRGQIGKDIFGWKGGDYTVNARELIYYAGHGDTGPAIAGLERNEAGIYEPVGVQETW